MSMTLTEAAKATGLDKSTIRRAVKSGKISGTRNAFGTWLVEPAELFRIYPPREETSGADVGVNSRAAADSAAVDALVAELRAAIARMEVAAVELRKDKDSIITDLRADRDKWRDQAERLALPAPAAAAAAPLTWWQWLRTTA